MRFKISSLVLLRHQTELGLEVPKADALSIPQEAPNVLERDVKLISSSDEVHQCSIHLVLTEHL